jgi:PAS domain S-box-containing protein
MNNLKLSILFCGLDTGFTGPIEKALQGALVHFSCADSPTVDEAMSRLGRERFDLLFLDAAYAQGRLAEVLEKIEHSGLAAPFVIATNVPGHEAGATLVLQGAHDYTVGERLEPATLVRAVRLIRERRALEVVLAQSDAQYAQLLRSVTDYTYTVSLENGRAGASSHGPGCSAVTGYSPGDYSSDASLWYRMIHDDDRPAVLTMAANIIAGRVPHPLEHRIIHKNGSIRWIRNTPLPRHDPQGHRIGYDGLVTDITDRKQAEQELLRANKALQVLSQSNQVLVRAGDETQLLNDVCRIIIEVGGYRMCWVGFAGDDAAKRFHPAAWAGIEDGYLGKISTTWDDGPNGKGPCGMSIRTRQPIVTRNIAAEREDSFWRGEALQRGYASCVSFPLLSGARPIGILAIYASEPGVFDESEVRHLQDLANDLAYGIAALRAQAANLHVEAALRQSELRLQQEFLKLERAKQEWEVTFDSIADPIFIHDRDCRIIRANKAYQEIAGLPFSELIGKHFYTIFPNLDDTIGNCWVGPIIPLSKQSYYVEEFTIPSLQRIFRGRVYPVNDDNGVLLYSIQVLEDITEMKKAEESIRQEMEVTANLLTLAEVATDTMDLDRLMERVVACCSKILSADSMLSYLWDPESRSLRPSCHVGLSHTLVPQFRTDVLEAGKRFQTLMLSSRRPSLLLREKAPFGAGMPRRLLCAPLSDDGEGALPVPLTDPFPWLADRTMFIAIPLIGKTDPLGLLVAGFSDHHSFTERSRKIVDGIYREVSLALDEAALYHTAMKRSMELAHKMETLKVIHEIDLSILSSLEPQEILETAIRNIARIIPCDRAEAMLLDTERQGFSRITDNGAGSGSLLPLEDTLAANVIATGRPHSVPDLREQGDLQAEESGLLKNGFLSLIRAPLIAKGNSIGVLGVASKRPASFTPENLATLEQLAGLIGVAFENTRLLTDLQELFLGTVKSLSYAIDAKSSWTAGHSERVTKYALLLGKELGLSDHKLRDLELVGLLHDVGKLGTFDAILDKNGKLTAEEFEIIKQHPFRGAELLRPIKQLKHIIPGVMHHHERFDGKGYPEGLKGGQIPDMARILAVADAFDSMTGWRPYRKTFQQNEAIEELIRCSGSQFDPICAQNFITALTKAGNQTVPLGRSSQELLHPVPPS